MPSPKRILITGAAGFVGANVARALQLDGHEVHATVRPGGNLWRLRDAQGLNVHELNLADGPAVLAAARKIEPEIILNFAVERAAPEEQDRIIRLNLLVTLNLLQAFRKLPFEILVHAGSSLEYGKTAHPRRESDVPVPDSPLGVAKACSALLVQQFARTVQRPVAILRLFSVYGPYEAHHRLLPTAILACLHNRELLLTEAGYKRDFIYVEDVIAAFQIVASRNDFHGEIFNIATGAQTSNEEVIQLISEITGKELRVRSGAYPARQTDTTFWVGDPGRAAATLGWRAQHSLRNGLEKTIQWFEKNHHLYSRSFL